MVDGKRLFHIALETGKRSRMKILRVDPEKNLLLETIENILQEALNLHRINTLI
jgi:hypothetical protein